MHRTTEKRVSELEKRLNEKGKRLDWYGLVTYLRTHCAGDEKKINTALAEIAPEFLDFIKRRRKERGLTE